MNGLWSEKKFFVVLRNRFLLILFNGLRQMKKE